MIDMFNIKKMQIGDIEKTISIVKKLFINSDIDELKKEFMQYLEKNDTVIYVCYLENEIIAFAQCQLRYDYVEGTNSSPVGYLEGIYVDSMYRKQGIATKLLEKCEKWSHEKGCTEFASDCELNNRVSFNFHLRAGFEEANRIICFRKKI